MAESRYQPATAAYGDRPQPAGLADVLELVLDKGVVIAGDIKINLLEIELLTIKIRLLIASVDKAREMGINWWESDPSLSSNGHGQRSSEAVTARTARGGELGQRVAALEKQLAEVTDGKATNSSDPRQEGGRVTSAAQVCWAYCVLPAGSEGIDAVEGVIDAPVRVVTGTASRSRSATCRPRSSGRTCCHARLADERWTVGLAMAHFRAIEAIFRAGPVLPLRLATVFSSAERALAMLDTHHDRLSEALVRVTGSAQWTVRVTVSAPRGTDVEASSGTDYLRAVAARRDDAASRHEADAAAAAELHQALADLSVAAERDTTSPPSHLLSGVYLVRAEQTGRFQDVLSRASEHPDALILDVRGPLAPYSFVPRLEEAA